MRCSQCEKMVSYGDPEATVESEGVDDEGSVHIEVRLVLPCAECGNELKDYTFSFDHELEHECDLDKVLCEKCNHSFTARKEPPDDASCSIEGCNCHEHVISKEDGFELEVSDPEPTDDYKPKVNAKGKPVPMRYQKHFFGVTVSGTATCNKCGEAIEFELSDEIQSSGMDEI